jgi:uncharacterized protein
VSPTDKKKRITDPVHGTIELTPLEFQVIGSPAFQRLRNVKQLGLAYLVYPGADYSRFSHSIGVCHVTGRILAALRERASVAIPDAEVQQYRLAALLHDIGHYPFSHAMERAIENHYKSQLVQPKQTEQEMLHQKSNGVPQRFLHHEDLSAKILEHDSALSAILNQADIPATDIYSTIHRKKPGRFANLVNSDLDADRIDYLLRTAHFTGLHYGSVDVDYLVTQLQVDDTDHICFTDKALRAADHLLLARYFDYQQVNYHKTVAALERLLEDVLEYMMDSGALHCSADSMIKKIQGDAWQSFDDLYVLSVMRDHHKSAKDEVAAQKIWSLLNRYPPRLVADFEYLANRDKHTKNEFKAHKRLVREHISMWAKQFGIDEKLWYLWDRPGITLTKVGSRFRDEAIENDSEDADGVEQSVRILDRDRKSSRRIVNVRHSLMSVIADYALYSLRIYVLLKPEQEALREKIRHAIRADLSEIEWK